MRFANHPLLAPGYWSTIAEAGAALAAASLATRVMPFRKYIKLGALPLRDQGDQVGLEAARIVDALARWVPFRAVCLQRGIALQWMLRRRGVDAILHYGVQLPKDGEELLGHVWVSVNGKVLIGAPQHQHYAEVARYPL